MQISRQSRTKKKKKKKQTRKNGYKGDNRETLNNRGETRGIKSLFLLSSILNGFLFSIDSLPLESNYGRKRTYHFARYTRSKRKRERERERERCDKEGEKKFHRGEKKKGRSRTRHLTTSTTYPERYRCPPLPPPEAVSTPSRSRPTK